MKNALGLLLLTLCLLAGGYTPASAKILDFDDVTRGSASRIHSGYGGFEWRNFGAVHKRAYRGTYRKGVVSQAYTAFNMWRAPASIASDAAFNFTGAHLTAIKNKNVYIDVIGMRDSEVVYKETVVVRNKGKAKKRWFEFNYENVDKVVFNPYHPKKWCVSGGLFAMDNFTFDDFVRTPEPSTMLLMGAGLLGLLGWRRRLTG